MVTNEQRAAWERDGYYILPGFADTALCAAMHARAVALARQAEGAGTVSYTHLTLPTNREV